MIASWLGAALAITSLGLISGWSHDPLVAALVSVICVGLLGTAAWVMGLAVGLTIALGQALRCLHPPAGAVALLGVLLAARPGFVLMPVLVGSLLLTAMAVLFSRLQGSAMPYPELWL
ncbi:MAG: HPP family protein [Vulcanococcus sp.]